MTPRIAAAIGGVLLLLLASGGCQVPDYAFEDERSLNQVPGPSRDAGAGRYDGGGFTIGPPDAGRSSLVVADVSVAVDPNGDGIVSPGERGYLQIRLRNATSASAAGLTGSLSTATSGVALTDATSLHFGTIAAGDQACAATRSSVAGQCFSHATYLPSFTVAASVAPGTEIQFTLRVSDQQQREYVISFSYSVRAIPQRFAVDEAEVVADTNGDGVVSPGEKGHLRITLRNTGQSAATALVGRLSTSSSSVTLSDASSLRFGDIAGGSTACGATQPSVAGQCFSSATYLPSFSVASSVAAGTKVSFTLSVVDAYDNAFELPFDYVLAPISQELAFHAADVVADTNGDGRVSPGETGHLRLTIRNTGGSTATGLTAKLTATQSTVTLKDANVLYFGDIAGGSQTCGATQSSVKGQCFSSPTYLPSFTVASSVTPGTRLDFKLTITDAFKNVFVVDFPYVVEAISQAFSVDAVDLVDDTSRDGMLTPGERGYLRIALRNSGDSTALKVTAKLTSSTPGAILANATALQFGDIGPGGVACGTTQSSVGGQCPGYGSYLPSLTFPSSPPASGSVDLVLTITDRFGNTFARNLSYP